MLLGRPEQVDGLSRTTTAQATQARHLFDHVRLAERHIDVVDSEKQQHAAENTRLREIVLTFEKRIHETEAMVESLRYEAKLQRAKFFSKNKDRMPLYSGPTSWKHDSCYLMTRTVL